MSLIQIAQNKCFSKTDVNWWISTNLPAELDKNMSLRWIKLFLKFSVALNLWLGLSQRKTMQIIKFRWVSVGFGLEKVDARLLFFSSFLLWAKVSWNNIVNMEDIIRWEVNRERFRWLETIFRQLNLSKKSIKNENC